MKYLKIHTRGIHNKFKENMQYRFKGTQRKTEEIKNCKRSI